MVASIDERRKLKEERRRIGIGEGGGGGKSADLSDL
jgi:hypothetical protein